MATVKKWTILVTLLMVAGGGFFIYQSRTRANHAALVADKLKSAVGFLENQQYSEAEDALRWLMVQAPSEQVMAMLAQVLSVQERHEEALEMWRRIADINPETGYSGEILLASALDAIRSKDLVSARDQMEKVVREYPATEVAIRAQMGLVDLAYRESDYAAARSIGMSILDDTSLPPADRGRLESILGEINLELLYSRQPTDDDQLYVIQRGDYISKIADQHSISQGLLMRVNGISDPKRISVGHRIKIPKLDLKLVVDKWSNTLTVYANGQFFKKYTIRTGKFDYMTPNGEFKILNKKENPQWTRPDTGEVLTPGHPENELGTRWMAFSGSQLGIHGTIHPETLGKYTSQGCVGMSREDVEELYDLVAVGTAIEIVGKQNPALKEEG